ncbi:MAG TPA: flagellar basal-body MS-ring/collar protein FliF [Rhizomicrobium sp.]|nr:flagellar basal-body MS-ring/collar protein FliF [Rhizomicrobium sp.]
MPEFVKAIGAARFGVMAGVAAALTAFFLYVAGALTEPAKSVLFSGLDPRDATAVTAKLDAMQEKYDIKGDGGTILVPSDDVTKLRMTLAADNLPSAGTGYEIFDKSDTFGTTAFVQNINKMRALEGELARSVQTIEGVDAARIHLVMPEHQLFGQNDEAPTGSVVLKTRGVLARGQVQAIQHLVAAAVSGLSPERVAIIDDKGNLLAGGEDKSGPDAQAANEENQTTGFEDRLRDRVESIVASVVGPGHVRVQVTADIAYTHTTETSETYDPDSKVVRSTQTVNTTNTDTTGGQGGAVSVGTALPGAAAPTTAGDGGKSNASHDEETINYEINKAIKTSAVDGGTVKKLSVAVVVDGTPGAGTSYKPRTPAEMKQITDLVKSTIGFDAKRGDIVQVDNMEFARMDMGDATPAAKPLLGLDGAEWYKIIEVAILSLTALLIGFFVARPLIARMFATSAPAVAGPASVPQLPAPDAAAAPGQEQAALPSPKAAIDIQRIEGQVRDSSIKKVGEVVSAHPDEALAIIRTWLHEPA